ncbi:MAG: 50S ribosomal protein L9 [Oscillospiraceae bacterium]|jgi:large subunit ribosomal protein L9|nr:50S ribosomal protein L9 [Oscillospiraceae bacterium]
MKVILQQDVRDHGKKGQLVEVSDGYARNFLIPRKLATAATNDNLNAMRQQEESRKRKAERERAEALETAAGLEELIVRVTAKAGAAGRLFGSVTSAEISDALLKQHGVTVEKNKLVLDENIKSFGSYAVKCKLGHEVSGVINVIVTEG